MNVEELLQMVNDGAIAQHTDLNEILNALQERLLAGNEQSVQRAASRHAIESLEDVDLTPDMLSDELSCAICASTFVEKDV